jgi:acetolactate synthase-1/2/3 large subunit
MSEQQYNGAEVVLRALVDQGVEVIFGYPGGAVLPLYDEIFKQNQIRHILVRHEQAALHAIPCRWCASRGRCRPI